MVEPLHCGKAASVDTCKLSGVTDPEHRSGVGHQVLAGEKTSDCMEQMHRGCAKLLYLGISGALWSHWRWPCAVRIHARAGRALTAEAFTSVCLYHQARKLEAKKGRMFLGLATGTVTRALVCLFHKTALQNVSVTFLFPNCVPCFCCVISN